MRLLSIHTPHVGRSRLAMALLAAPLVWAMLASPTHAQTLRDGVRYGGTQPLGTARVMGLAGAGSALGADLSALTLNPAGLGLYQASDMGLSTAFTLAPTTASYLGTQAQAGRFRMLLPQVGFVFSKPVTGGLAEDQALKRFSFGLGISPNADYSRRTQAYAFNARNSITDFFASRAQGIPYGNLNNQSFYGALAFANGVIDTVPGTVDQYRPALAYGNITQELDWEEAGMGYAITLAGAVDLNHRVMIGLAVNVHLEDYESDFWFWEYDTENLYQNYVADSTPASFVRHYEGLNTRGLGVSARMGALVQATDRLRLSFTAQTPTYLSMEDLFSAALRYGLDGGETFDATADPTAYNYTLITPYQVGLGALLTFGRRGLLTVDASLTDHRTLRFEGDGGSVFRDLNAQTDSLLALAWDVRLGGEVRFGKFYTRAGASLTTSPYSTAYRTYPATDLDGAPRSWSGLGWGMAAGLGYRGGEGYIDLAFRLTQDADGARLYDLPEDFHDGSGPYRGHPAWVSNRRTLVWVALTVGARFGHASAN